jgi:hypothetical protein
MKAHKSLALLQTRSTRVKPVKDIVLYKSKPVRV